MSIDEQPSDLLNFMMFKCSAETDEAGGYGGECIQVIQLVTVIWMPDGSILQSMVGDQGRLPACKSHCTNHLPSDNVITSARFAIHMVRWDDLAHIPWRRVFFFLELFRSIKSRMPLLPLRDSVSRSGFILVSWNIR
jgi:hypothetical protein